MSCRSTSGGSVSTSLAKTVSGLSDSNVQRLFHALKREGADLPGPSELDMCAWRSRQEDLLFRMRRMPETRRDTLASKLFRSRSEPVPDGATFYAWSRIEARARQEAVIRDADEVIDLEPPGSQSDEYDLDENGRPRVIWYSSYGSNLNTERFLTYIQGGQPPGSSRTYEGCSDTTLPAEDIAMRYPGRTHFALTSRVWHGGIAFMDQEGEGTTLGRAYLITADQFDQVVAQENGEPAQGASQIPLGKIIANQTQTIGPGAYQTMVHVGDYQGAPVITFTAPFGAQEALHHRGHLTRNQVRMPVRTNKPSAAYVRMIGEGLRETFGFDEIQQADYIRGCPGGDRWDRRDLVKTLRNLPPELESEPEATLPHEKAQDTPAAPAPAVPEAVFSNSKPQSGSGAKAQRSRRSGRQRSSRSKSGEFYPAVKQYRTAAEQQVGVERWAFSAAEVELRVQNYQEHLDRLTERHHTLRADPNGAVAADAVEVSMGIYSDKVLAEKRALAEVQAKFEAARSQTPPD